MYLNNYERQFSFLSLNHDDQVLFEKMIDFLGAHLDYFMNYKEFIEWFFLKDVFQIMHDGSNIYHATLTKSINGF
jgi:hypothetical protein